MTKHTENNSFSSRKLAAIMFTDIVGYTSLMGRDEDKALKILENNRAIHKDLLILYEGKLLKELGDGMLCSFDSASKAVKCGIELIRKSNEYKGLKLRIGIHVGEVVFSSHDVFGDGVNIASRIESIAVADSVLISGKVYDEIKNKHNIKVKHLGAFRLKNDTGPREIYAITNSGLKMPSKIEIDQNKKKTKSLDDFKATVASPDRSPATKKWINMANPRIGLTVIFSLMAIAFGSFLFVNFRNNTKVKWAREEAIIQIEKHIEQAELKQAFNLAKEAEKYIPNDPLLTRLWPKMDFYLSIDTNPSEASVYRKLVDEPDSGYELVGITPLDSVQTYNNYSTWKIEKEGYLPLEFMNVIWVMTGKNYRLFKPGELPDQMVLVTFDQWSYFPTGWISGLREVEKPILEDYYIDQYEVTNSSFKEFVDAGGYKNKSYWDEQFVFDGKEISWEEAMRLFVDKTGQAGPSTWEVGDYPNGHGDYPVNGISWYEAMAFAKYAGKSLPSVFHWIFAAAPGRGDLINPASNFLGEGPEPQGTNKGLSVYGTYDMAGNVREWCYNNAEGKNDRFILGGAWDELPYNFSSARVINPLDRSEMNGFRCIRYLEKNEEQETINSPIPMEYRDFYAETPVDDKTFQLFLHNFEYEKTDFEEEIQEIDFGDPDFSCQKIYMNSPYNVERICLYLFTPKNQKEPYQTVYFFPSSWSFELDDFESNFDLVRFEFDFFLKSGRAVAHPILPNTYGRNIKGNVLSRADRRRLFITQSVMDIKRHIDYLETRKEFNISKLGYYGFSLGAAMGPVICALEKRIEAAVWTVGGLTFFKRYPEYDPFNYLPRVNTPVLMLNGKHDHIFPLEPSQTLMFDLIGTPDENKKLILYEVGHTGPPRHELIKESLNWMDIYLGPVEPSS
jgi:class 3 adenylate cyclase